MFHIVKHFNYVELINSLVFAILLAYYNYKLLDGGAFRECKICKKPAETED